MTKTSNTTPSALDPKFVAWLIKNTQPSVTPEDVQQVAEHLLGLEFLIAWSLFERRCFGCYANGPTIKTFAGKKCVKECFPKIESDWNHFYRRYTNKVNGSKYISKLFPDFGPRGSINKRDSLLFEKRLTEKLTAADKTELMATVIFRFRNNIFHGSKKPYTWPKYEPQIKRCIRTIMIWVDGYSENSEV